MKSYNLFSQKEDKTNWFIFFLQNKEKELVKLSGNKRVKTQKKLYYCEQGKFNYPFVYVKSNYGRIYSPLRLFLNLGKNQKMSPEFKAKLEVKSSRTTYQKAVEDIFDSFNFKISKKTLNRYVIEDGNKLDILTQPSSNQNILIGDSTKVRNGKKGHHEVFGFIALDYETNESSLVSFEINESPAKIAEKIDFNQYQVFVGDADLGLRNFYQNKIDFHLCHQHAINDVSFYLWRDGMKKKEKEFLMKKFKSILFTLKNSTEKYWKDNKNGRLINRIIRTKKNLRSFAAELSTLEKHEAARFVMDHIEHMVTAAKYALLGVRVPWTTNHAERLMQEIGIRTKKKGMNWTEKGLNAILKIVLNRYFLPKNRRNYKEIMNINYNKVVEI